MTKAVLANKPTKIISKERVNAVPVLIQQMIANLGSPYKAERDNLYRSLTNIKEVIEAALLEYDKRNK